MISALSPLCATPLTITLLLLLLLSCIPALRVAHSASIAESARRTAYGEKLDRTTNLSDLTNTLDQLIRASSLCPDDAELHQYIADRHIHAYRLVSFPKLLNIKTEKQTEDELWNTTSPTVIHALCWRLHANNQTKELQSYRDDNDVQQQLIPALKCLYEARHACPLLPKPHLGLAELASLLSSPQADLPHIARVQNLCPSGVDNLYRCGALLFAGGRADETYASWRQSLALSGKYLKDLTGMAGKQVTIWNFVENVLPADPAMLISVAKAQTGREDLSILRKYLLSRSERLLNSPDIPPDSRAFLSGQLAMLQGRPDRAAALLRQAVDLRPEELDWRYEWACALRSSGDPEEAYRQARWCARMAPRNAIYRKLVTEIQEADTRKAVTIR